MIPVHHPQISLQTLLQIPFTRKGRERCEAWYRHHTGKKYVLVTDSCRMALWLTYKVSDGKGKVLTTPLTCFSALDPVLASGLLLQFCDVSMDDLLMDCDKAESAITGDTGFIQAIHHGGRMTDMKRLREIADRHHLMLIEDCAQGFGASRDGISAGRLGDVACFTLAKNAWGIGGGILATDHQDLYHRARAVQEKLPATSKWLIHFRMLRSLIEAKRGGRIAGYLYKLLMDARPEKEPAWPAGGPPSIPMRKPVQTYARLFVLQQPHFADLHDRLEALGGLLEQELIRNGLNLLPPSHVSHQNSNTKFFMYHPGIHLPEAIVALEKKGIETRHLENSYGSPRQPGANENRHYREVEGLKDCVHYFSVHDHLLQLPLHPDMQERDRQTIVNALHTLLKHETDSD